PSKGDLLDDELLRIEKGYGPEQAVEIQTLVGDSTDNIPGAAGVGVKTAVRLISTYGTAEEVVANADALTPKLKENVLLHAEQMDLTRRLVTLDRNAPFEIDLEACRAPSPDLPQQRTLLGELGFRTFGEQFAELYGSGAEAKAAESAVDAGTTAYVVTTEEQLDELVALLSQQPVYALDTETTSLLAVDAEVVGYAFSWQSGEGWYVPVRGNDAGEKAADGTQLAYLDPGLVAAKLKPVLEDPTSLKVGQNLKYDMNVLSRAGIDLQGKLFDTMVAAALLHPERRTNNMDDLARDMLGLKTTPITELIGKGKNQVTMLDVPLPQVAAYAAEDADVTWRLYEKLKARLEGEHEAMQHLFADVEMPLVRVLAAMEREGVELDAGMLGEYSQALTVRLEELKQNLFKAAGMEFNPDSPKQLGEVLFDKLGLPVIKKTKTGRSTDAEVLERLASESDHPLPQLL